MPFIQNIIKAGTLALSELEKEQEWIVLGVTSRGVFLRNSTDRVIFLSEEGYCSPLTVLVAGNNGLFRQVSVGNKVSVSSEGLFFPEAGILININSAVSWSPKNVPNIQPEKSPKYADRLIAVSGLVIAEKKDQGFSPLLAKLLDIPTDILLSREQQYAYEIIWQFKEMIKDYPDVRVINQLESLLGLGRGLTPSGDDFVMGLLLAFTRWQSILDPLENWSTIKNEIVQSAYRKTTLLSANLIEMAASGSGDERLIMGLDGIMCGDLDETACAANFISLGNSSGADALAGIALAIL
jgi:Protein of unknown function (DUF2877)